MQASRPDLPGMADLDLDGVSFDPAPPNGSAALDDQEEDGLSEKAPLSPTGNNFSVTGSSVGTNCTGISLDTEEKAATLGHTWGQGWGFQRLQPVFVDAADMKAKVRAQLHEPTYNVFDYYKKEGVFQELARSQRFETLVFMVIGMNAIWIAIDTDKNTADVLTMAHPVFQIMEHFFCTFFTVEWFIRFMAFDKKSHCLKDGWFCFDTLLVLLLVLETWVMSVVIFVSGGEANLFSNKSILLRLLRLLRLSRMARVARLLRAFPELMILIKGMIAAMRSVLVTLCLLLLIIYVFSIAFKQLTEQTSVGDKYFSTVPASMYTLLIQGTLLDSIGNLMKDVGQESAFIAIILLVFVLLAALTVMNMLIGVLCEVVSAVAAVEKEELAVNFVKGKLEGIVREIDKNGNLEIEKSEFGKLLENENATKALQEVGVDVAGLVDLADIIFENETSDGYKTLTFAQFMETVLELRGSCQATVKDMVNLRKYIRTQTSTTVERLQRIEEKLDTVAINTAPRAPSRPISRQSTKDQIEKGVRRLRRASTSEFECKQAMRRSISDLDSGEARDANTPSTVTPPRQRSASPDPLVSEASRSAHYLSRQGTGNTIGSEGSDERLGRRSAHIAQSCSPPPERDGDGEQCGGSRSGSPPPERDFAAWRMSVHARREGGRQKTPVRTDPRSLQSAAKRLAALEDDLTNGLADLQEVLRRFAPDGGRGRNDAPPRPSASAEEARQRHSPELSRASPRPRDNSPGCGSGAGDPWSRWPSIRPRLGADGYGGTGPPEGEDMRQSQSAKQPAGYRPWSPPTVVERCSAAQRLKSSKSADMYSYNSTPAILARAADS